MKVKELVAILPASARVSVIIGKKQKELLRQNVTDLFNESRQTHSIYRDELNMEVAMLETVALKPLWFVIRAEWRC